MIMLLKFSNFPNELSKNDELREYELSGPDCIISFRSASNVMQQKRTTLLILIIHSITDLIGGTPKKGLWWNFLVAVMGIRPDDTLLS